MAENDLMVRVKRAKKFLLGNDKVRFNVWFRGRQMSKRQFGYDLLKKVMNELGLERYCCRAIFLGHIDLIDTVARFKKA